MFEYLTIRLRARDFYAVIVDEGEARINYHRIEIESESKNRERVKKSRASQKSRATKNLIFKQFFKRNLYRKMIVSLLAIYRGIDGE